MKSSKKNFMVFIATAFFAVSLLIFFFVYRDINIKNFNTEEILLKWQSEYSKRDEVRSLERFAREIEPQKFLLETHFAQSSDIVPFLDTIEALAAKVSAKTEVSSVGISEDKDGLMVEMKASGSFQSVYNFLVLLENSPYELDIIAADISRGAGQSASSKKPVWDAIFKIKLLSFIQ